MYLARITHKFATRPAPGCLHFSQTLGILLNVQKRYHSPFGGAEMVNPFSLPKCLSQSSEFYSRNSLRCLSASVYCSAWCNPRFSNSWFEKNDAFALRFASNSGKLHQTMSRNQGSVIRFRNQTSAISVEKPVLSMFEGRQARSNISMFSLSSHSAGIVHQEFVPPGQTVN